MRKLWLKFMGTHTTSGGWSTWKPHLSKSTDILLEKYFGSQGPLLEWYLSKSLKVSVLKY